MSVSRRQFLLGLGSFSLYMAGCASQPAAMTRRPGPEWPTATPRPTRENVYPVRTPLPTPPVTATQGRVQVISRSAWTKRSPLRSSLNPMNGISRITVHHEGWKAFWDTDQRTTADRIEMIRRAHVEDRGWADIGYHYIVDRAGRVWEGRQLGFQGAHVRDTNEHNLGILVLGNFDQQRPTDPQFGATHTAIREFMRQYRVPVSRVYTHQELKPTACPGTNLQHWMVNVRRNGSLA